MSPADTVVRGTALSLPETARQVQNAAALANDKLRAALNRVRDGIPMRDNKYSRMYHRHSKHL